MALNRNIVAINMLSDKQIEQFQRQGYLVLENVIDQRLLSAIKSEYADLLDGLYAGWVAQGVVDAPPADADFWRKLDHCLANDIEWYQHFDISLPHADISSQTPMHFGPGIFNLITSDNILDIVETFIGGEITSNPIQHIRIKPPQRTVPASETRAHIVSTDWHQDQGVTLEEADETRFLTVWVAITDSTVENGCLQVEAGKHTALLPHCPSPQVNIPRQLLREEHHVPLPVKAGGVILLDPLTPHSSLTNNSDSYRWSFDLRYNVTGQPTGRSHFPEFIARSRKHPDRVLRDWRKWEGMWKATRERLSQQAHIPQHRWQHDENLCA